MKKPNPNVAKTHINIDPALKAYAIKLAKDRWGKSGNLSMLFADLLANAHKIYETEKPDFSKK